MSDKLFKIVGNDMSDGYHTFDELYEHRILLYLLWLVDEKGYKQRRNVYWVKDHLPDWDLVATNIGNQQISYHVPISYRDVLQKHFVQRDTLDHVWDGHTAADVADRMRDWIRSY